MTDKDKLAHLLEHWVEHNNAHADTFRDWEKRAREMNLEEVAKNLGHAAETLDHATRHLERAHDLL